MRAKGSFVVEYESAAEARAAHAALSSEKGFERARCSIHAQGSAVALEIDADDIVAFRAAANSLLRNLQVFEAIGKNMFARGKSQR